MTGKTGQLEGKGQAGICQASTRAQARSEGRTKRELRIRMLSILRQTRTFTLEGYARFRARPSAPGLGVAVNRSLRTPQFIRLIRDLLEGCQNLLGALLC